MTDKPPGLDVVVLLLDAEVTRANMPKGGTLRARSGLDRNSYKVAYVKTFGVQASASTGLAA